MRRLLLCLLLLAGMPAASRAQEPPAVQTEVAAPASDAATEAAAPSQSSGLPVAAAPPRTMRAYWHVFIAFAIAWALLFGYVVVLGRRFGMLEKEIKRLEGTGA
jgi:CcmD family protein